jgi:hypothetical protein
VGASHAAHLSDQLAALADVSANTHGCVTYTYTGIKNNFILTGNNFLLTSNKSRTAGNDPIAAGNVPTAAE